MKLPSEDGVTHINIYSKGQTNLGTLLSNFTYSPFEHPEDGHFDSIEGYWYWLSTKDDQLRTLYGWGAKEYGRAIGGNDWMDDEEFKFKIKQAIFLKIKNFSLLEMDLFVTSKLPFTHYYVYAGKVVEPKEGKWIIDFITECRSVFKVMRSFE